MAEYGSDDGRWFVRPTSVPKLNPKQFDLHIRFNRADRYSNHGAGSHMIRMEDNKSGEFVGGIEWHKDTGEILGVETEKPYRRKGVATTLFHEAKNIAREQGLVQPAHSADRSDMGHKWAKSIDSNLPKRKKLSDFPVL